MVLTEMQPSCGILLDFTSWIAGECPSQALAGGPRPQFSVKRMASEWERKKSRSVICQQIVSMGKIRIKAKQWHW